MWEPNEKTRLQCDEALVLLRHTSLRHKFHILTSIHWEPWFQPAWALRDPVQAAKAPRDCRPHRHLGEAGDAGKGFC